MNKINIMSSLSEQINRNNIKFVRNQIAEKINYAIPYYARARDTTKVITDLDNHPYERYYRGVYYSDDPIVFEREAGFRPVENPCYKSLNCQYVEEYYPNHCIQTACSTVFPCFPETLRSYNIQEELNLILNRTCVNKSP